jgi:hypothetical protein
MDELSSGAQISACRAKNLSESYGTFLDARICEHLLIQKGYPWLMSGFAQASGAASTAF